MLIWTAIGCLLLLVGAVSFARADRLADVLVMYRTRRDRADADRVLMTITGFRIISSLLAVAGALLVATGLALA